jgi:hypothetical protein
MAKRHALLFELMKEEPKTQESKGVLDNFLRKTSEQSSAAEESHPSIIESAPKPSTTADEQTVKNRLYLKLNRQSIATVAGIIFVLMFICYLWGKHNGYSQGIAMRSSEQISEIQSGPIEAEVLDIKPKSSSGKKMVNSEKSAADLQDQEKVKNDKEFTRKKGLNYLIIEVFKKMESEQQAYKDAEQARRFLSEKGVNATIEDVGKYYVLMSTAGFKFKKLRDNPDAEQYIDMIKALGKEYRQKPESKGIDFKLCYFQQLSQR